MTQKITLEEFGDLLQEAYGSDAPRLIRENVLSIRDLREKLGLVFSRDVQGNLDIQKI